MTLTLETGSYPNLPDALDDYPVITPVTLRFSDQDPLGHVNNVAVTALLESGRVALIRELFAGFDLRPGATVLANLNVDYRREILFPDTVLVGARLIHVGKRSFRSAISVFQNGTCCVISSNTNVFFDRETRRSADPSQSLRTQMLDVLAHHSEL